MEVEVLKLLFWQGPRIISSEWMEKWIGLTIFKSLKLICYHSWTETFLEGDIMFQHASYTGSSWKNCWSMVCRKEDQNVSSLAKSMIPLNTDVQNWTDVLETCSLSKKISNTVFNEPDWKYASKNQACLANHCWITKYSLFLIDWSIVRRIVIKIYIHLK